MADRPIRSAATKTPTWTELNELTSSSLGGEVNVLEPLLLCFRCSYVENWKEFHTYLIFVIFFTQAKFLENKIYTEIYTVNCQFTQ